MEKILQLIDGKNIRIPALDSARSDTIFSPLYGSPTHWVSDSVGFLTHSGDRSFSSPRTKVTDILPYEALKDTDYYEIAQRVKTVGSDIEHNTLHLQQVRYLLEKQLAGCFDIFQKQEYLPTVFFVIKDPHTHPVFEGRIYKSKEDWGISTEPYPKKIRHDIPKGSYVYFTKGLGKTL